MNNYKITIQYDGTRYKGWQGQNSTGLTIQGKIEAVLGQMAGHAVEVIGSGRTDAGVHAKGQVANFHIEEHSGLTRLTGERMDGMPEHLHKNNFVWESGVRLGFSLPFNNHQQ